MPTILDYLDKKTPHYPSRFRHLVDRLSRNRAFDKSVGTEEEKFSQGKVFANYYECFLYATILGMRQNYRIPFDRNAEGSRFLLIGDWKPRQLVEYVFMGLLVKADLQLIDLEELDEQQTNAKASELETLLEEYANGGFDLIQSKLAEDPQLFENAYGAVGLLNSLAKAMEH
ncbi:hypothetical protein JYG30_11505 [Fibrella sp. USSR17]